MTGHYPPRPQDCATCNTNGPELPTSLSALLDVHRASHDAMQAITQPFIDFLKKRARRSEEDKAPWRELAMNHCKDNNPLPKLPEQAPDARLDDYTRGYLDGAHAMLRIALNKPETPMKENQK